MSSYMRKPKGDHIWDYRVNYKAFKYVSYYYLAVYALPLTEMSVNPCHSICQEHQILSIGTDSWPRVVTGKPVRKKKKKTY